MSFPNTFVLTVRPFSSTILISALSITFPTDVKGVDGSVASQMRKIPVSAVEKLMKICCNPSFSLAEETSSFDVLVSPGTLTIRARFSEERLKVANLGKDNKSFKKEGDVMITFDCSSWMLDLKIAMTSTVVLGWLFKLMSP